MPDSAASSRIQLWDWPVRLSHWGFAALVPALWLSAEAGRMDLHKQLGLVMLALVVFRLGWGLVGSTPARFASFLAGPRRVLAYLRGGTWSGIGHNPLGGWSVAALLAMLSVQLSLGLICEDSDGLESGPLIHYVSYDTAALARAGHELGFDLLAVLVGVHLAAIAWYRFRRREDLVTPMLTGRRRFAHRVAQPQMAPAWRAVVLAALAGALAWWVGQGAPLGAAA